MSKKKSTLNVVLREGKILKNFQRVQKIVEMIKELSFSGSAIYFKINFAKILEKCAKLKTSSLLLNPFRSYLKTIKEMSKESGSEFKWLFYGTFAAIVFLKLENVGLKSQKKIGNNFVKISEKVLFL